MFRGFENISSDYGMIMAILGGDDAGGGVIWAPQVIEDARNDGLVLGEDGKLYDTKKGDTLPDRVGPMQAMPEGDIAKLREPATADVVPHYVARYWDLMALADKAPARVIGKDAILHDRPGFEVEFVTRGSANGKIYTSDQHEVLMPVRGNWHLEIAGNKTVLNPGDTAAVPPGVTRAFSPSMSGEASLYIVRSTDDEAGPTLPL